MSRRTQGHRGNRSNPGHRPWSCRVLGCRWWFDVAGTDLVWSCARCDTAGSRHYADAHEAQHMADVLNRSAPGPPTGLLAALGGTLHRPTRGERRG